MSQSFEKMGVAYGICLVLLLFAFREPTGAELPENIGMSPFQLGLYTGDPLMGQEQLFVLTNGLAYVQIMQPPQNPESTMQEWRYKIQLGAAEMQSIRTLLDQHHFMALKSRTRPGVPDESLVVISIRLSERQCRDISQWQSDVRGDWASIYEYLLGIASRAVQTKPIYRGAEDYAWLPPDFEK